MSDTPRSDAEAVWAESGTGDEFQCVDLSFARELECEINELRADKARLDWLANRLQDEKIYEEGHSRKPVGPSSLSENPDWPAEWRRVIDEAMQSITPASSPADTA